MGKAKGISNYQKALLITMLMSGHRIKRALGTITGAWLKGFPWLINNGVIKSLSSKGFIGKTSNGGYYGQLDSWYLTKKGRNKATECMKEAEELLHLGFNTNVMRELLEQMK